MLTWKFRFKNKDINLISHQVDNLNLIIINSFLSCSNEVFNLLSKKCKHNFAILEISNLDWNSDLSPWKMDKVLFFEDDFQGNGDIYLDELVSDIIPKIVNYLESNNIKVNRYILSGYSLAGLFALYASYKVDLFTDVVSASGSLWFRNFDKFVTYNKISKSVKNAYFSIGNKEYKTKHPVLSITLDRIMFVKDSLSSQGVNTYFEENPGNHFVDSTIRLIKGIRWVLKQK